MAVWRSEISADSLDDHTAMALRTELLLLVAGWPLVLQAYQIPLAATPALRHAGTAPSPTWLATLPRRGCRVTCSAEGEEAAEEGKEAEEAAGAEDAPADAAKAAKLAAKAEKKELREKIAALEKQLPSARGLRRLRRSSSLVIVNVVAAQCRRRTGGSLPIL